MPPVVSLVGQTSGTAANPREISVTTNLMLTVSASDPNNPANICSSAAVHISLMDNTSLMQYPSSTQGGQGVTQFSVTVVMPQSDPRFGKVCKMVPHGNFPMSGGDKVGQAVEFVKFVA